MKKKLVAFAVTAAMVITSAVPVFAVGGWGETNPVSDSNPNVVTVSDKGVVTDDVSGALSATPKTFDTIIDLNDGPTVFPLDTLKLTFTGSDGKDIAQPVVLQLEKADNVHTFVALNNGSKKDQYGTGIEGIATAAWSITNEYVTVELYENGNMYNPVATLEVAVPAGAVAVKNLTATAATGKTFKMYLSYPTYVEEISVMIKNPDFNTKRPASDSNPEYVEATQPVIDETLYVKGATLTGGTVVAENDLAKYLKAEWYLDDEKVHDGWSYTPGDTAKGHKVIVKVSGLKADSGVFGEKSWGEDNDAIARFVRFAGENRYETAMAIADGMKPKAGFANIIVACGTDYADALSGTSLASKLTKTEGNTPILLVNGEYEDAVVEYINDNAASFGTDIYILGGETAVAKSFADKVNKYDVKRLGGEDRYATNIAILKELGLEKETPPSRVLVASGLDYADALSASATGYPVMIVGKNITKTQKDYLKTLGGNDYYNVIGGTKAVGANVMNTLKSKDYVTDTDKHVTRIAGVNRYETSAEIYNAFKETGYAFAGASNVVVASGNNYPDGLAIAAFARVYNAPLLLVNENNTRYANKVIGEMSAINQYGVYVAGGEAAVSNEAVQKIAAKVDSKIA